jgi:hypothetical protein
VRPHFPYDPNNGGNYAEKEDDLHALLLLTALLRGRIDLFSFRFCRIGIDQFFSAGADSYAASPVAIGFAAMMEWRLLRPSFLSASAGEPLSRWAMVVRSPQPANRPPAAKRRPHRKKCLVSVIKRASGALALSRGARIS